MSNGYDSRFMRTLCVQEGVPTGQRNKHNLTLTLRQYGQVKAESTYIVIKIPLSPREKCK